MAMAGRTAVPKARCSNCGAPVRAKDRFCATCGQPIAAARLDATAAASASLQVGTGSKALLSEQRKVVTILFADLSGSTPLAERLDPEELRRILGSYFNQLARQIQRYEGTIDKYIGDAVMATFGAPLSHEDDAERAIRAALAMQASIARLNDDLDRDYGVRLSLRIGINTGEVVAGLLGGDVQHAYTVVGDAVNTAQRFEAAAPLGEILVSETTRRLAIHAFEFERLPPLTLKGKKDPVQAYRVQRRRDEEIEPDASPLVGRADELERLRALLAGPLNGRGHVVAIVGEAGVGKTRLVGEFTSGLSSGVERMVARCASFEMQTPYALVAALIRAAFRIHAADDEQTAALRVAEGFTRYGQVADARALTLFLDVLGYSERSSFDPKLKREMLVATLRAVLAAAGAMAPFVIAAEDLHWSDTASISVLAELVVDIPSLPCLFISTSRPSWTPPWGAEPFAVEALSDEDSRSLVEEIFESSVDDRLAGAILGRAGGNPFFIEELVRAIREAAQTVGSDGTLGSPEAAATTLPDTVQEVIEARLDRLPDAARQVVQPASVIGRTFWYRLLERLVPGIPLAEQIGVLEREMLIAPRAIHPELTYGFRQALTQEVAYRTQLQAVRRATHGAIAVAIETLFSERLDEFIDVLAYHYDRSDDQHSALRWLVRAADRAKSLFANDEALSLYAGALRRAADGDGDGSLDAGRILERVGEVQALVGRYDEALASFTAARDRGSAAPPRLARLERRAGAALAKQGAYDEARARFEHGLELFGGEDNAEAARVGLELGQLLWRRGDHPAARAALGAAAAMGDRIGSDDIAAEAEKQLGNVAYLAGEPKEAEARYERSRDLYERAENIAGIADVRSNLGGLYGRMGRWDDALSEFAASLALRARMGNPWGVATCHNNIGEVHRVRGDAEAAVASFGRALEIWSSIGYASGVALALVGLGAAEVDAGRPVDGRERLRDAERRFAALGSTSYLPDLYRYLAMADLAEGDLGKAWANAQRSLDLARAASGRQQAAIAQRVLGELALARGDRDAARAFVAESCRELSELGDIAELARSQEVARRISG
jgi:class 3 adenylate cyclase/tetratricopeptide (TPR) repeat protein